MAEDERAALEQRYFSDHRVFEQLVQVENDLVDRYAHGLLLPSERKSFEGYYLAHPGRQERAEFAKVLAIKIKQTSGAAAAQPARTESLWNRWLATRSGPRFVWAFAIALLLIFSIGAWLLFQTRPPQPKLPIIAAESPTPGPRYDASPNQAKIAQTPSENQQVAAAPHGQQPPPVSTTPTPSVKEALAFVSLTFTITGTRNAEQETLNLMIPARADQVRQQINLRENDYRRYNVVVRAVGGKEIFTRRQLATKSAGSGTTFTLTVPASRFATGDYILTLQGVSETGEVEDVSKSLFHVETK
jgi:hypothetical protein